VIERAVALDKTPLVLPESLPAHLPGGAKAVGKSAGTGELPSRLPDITEGFDLEAAWGGVLPPLHRPGTRKVRRRPDEGGRDAGNELPLIPVLRQEAKRQIADGR
jgi:hypothetical protein